MRVGVIGPALIGGVHIPRWQAIEDATLVAGCDLDSDLAERIGREQGIRTYTNAESMLDAEELDAISICAPAKTHFPLTKLAADRGMHVLCEKPMASNVEDCRRMIAVCRERGVTLMIGHTKRYVPMLTRLRELIDGELGSADYVLHQYPDPGKSPRDWSWDDDNGGGPLLDNWVHATDVLCYLLGDVERVYAEGDNFFARAASADRLRRRDAAVHVRRDR